MLVLSILFFTVAILLVYSLTKDTGANTMHARGNTKAQYVSKIEHKQEEHNTISTAKAIKAG